MRSDRPEPVGHQVKRLIPAGLAKYLVQALRIDRKIFRTRSIVAPDQRPGQALRMVHVIKAEASLDAKTLRVGRTITALDMCESVFEGG